MGKLIFKAGCLVGLLILAMGLSAMAQPHNVDNNETLAVGGAAAKRPLPNEVPKAEPIDEVPTLRVGDKRINKNTGALLALYHVNFTAEADTPEAMAQEYLQANLDALQLKAPDLSDLVHRTTRQSDAGSVVRFRQEIDGVPIYRSDVAVTINKENKVVFVMVGYDPSIQITDVTPSLSAMAAKQIALDQLQVQGTLAQESTRLVVFPDGVGGRLAYEVTLVPSQSPIGEWEILIGAHTGEVLQVTDRSDFADGTGNVFNPDPLSSSGADYGDTGFTDSNDADLVQLNAELESITLQDIQLSGGTYTLTGPFANIVDFEAPFKGIFSQANASFSFSREQDGFEAVNTYYHIDSFMRYINNELGLNIMPYQYAGGVQFDPHGLNGADNSHYIRSTGQLSFGEGGVDDAEDADVIIHELGHGLHDWVTNGSASRVEGLGEGTGDYLGQSYSRAFNQWTPNDPQFHWFFNWDGHNEFWSGRITNYAPQYPSGLTGMIHTDGQIWSTCLMRIWDKIGRQDTDRAVLQGLSMTTDRSNQEDAAQTVLQAAENMAYAGGVVHLMEGILQNCGYNVRAMSTADLNEDGRVDLQDLLRLLRRRGQSAAEDDPADRDHDGRITVLDARQLVLNCTSPRCA